MSHETLPSPFWHCWSAPLLLVPLLSEGQWSWDTRKAHGIKKRHSYLLSFTKLCPHRSPHWRPGGPHQTVRNCDVPQDSSLNFCFVLWVTAHALLPLSQCLSPSLWRKSAGVTAKAAHTHSHADRQEASTNPKEDFYHPPLLLLLLPPCISLLLLSNSFAHEWGCCQSAGPGSPADHTKRKIRNWPIKSIRINFCASLNNRHPQTRSSERKREANRSYSFSAHFCAGNNKCAVTLGCLGCGLPLKDMVMVNQTWVVFILTKSL